MDHKELMAKVAACHKKRLIANATKLWEYNPVEERLTALQTDVKEVKSKVEAAPKSKSPKGKQASGDRPVWLKDNVKPESDKSTC